MTAQQVFEKIIRHLRKQNAKASQDGICRYRTTTGKMCAVGCLIPDTNYTHKIEGKGVLTDSVFNALPEEIRPHVNLLKDMQRIHDVVPVEEWEQGFAKVAHEHHLTVPPKARKAREFVDEFGLGKVNVCHEGLRWVKDRLAEGRTIRWLATDEAARAFADVSAFPLAFSLVWAMKEWDVERQGAKNVDVFYALMTKVNTDHAPTHVCRDYRWNVLKQAMKLVGVTHYSN